MTQKRRNSKALAERRPRALLLPLSGFTQDEIARGPRAACCPRGSGTGGQPSVTAASASTRWESKPIGARILLGLFSPCWGNSFAHLCTFLRILAHSFTSLHISSHFFTFLHISARTWNRHRRRANHCVNVTYIAGDAPLASLGADVGSAWTSIAKGLISNDLCTGASLPRRPTLREKIRFID